MKDRTHELNELIDYFGGYIEFEKPVRIKLTPHQREIKILSFTKGQEIDYNYIDTIIQRLKWLKHLKEK